MEENIPNYSNGIVVNAKDLRIKEKLKRIPDDRPGWYRWWAPEDALMQLLNAQGHPELKKELTKGSGKLTGYYYIYVGITKMSLRSRLNWHVNDPHTDSRIKHRTLSTLRKSIVSLVGQDQLDKAATNAFIDQLLIEYFVVDSAIGSNEAKEIISNAEQYQMQHNALLLNIRGNHHPAVSIYTSALRVARRTV